MTLGFLLDKLTESPAALAVAEPGGTYTYLQLRQRVSSWGARLEDAEIEPGTVVGLEGDYGVEAIAALLALAAAGCVAVPLASDSCAYHEKFSETAQVEARLRPGPPPVLEPTDRTASHPLYDELQRRGHPGLVLFTSGSTGESKAAVHDLVALAEKFRRPRHRLRTLVFLQLDHIGGINTLLYTLSNGGAVVVPRERTPEGVADAVARHRVELLPTSPTFLGLLLLSGADQRHDLSSLELITYGTEPMPESTLRRVRESFPRARLLQTYGTTELGILRSKSRDSGSLWVRVGGEGYETRIRDGRLWVRAASPMLGYLNAEMPVDEDGFFDTGDRVEADGEWLRILGREEERINVGGSKVYPAEVESVLLEMDNVTEAAVRGERHPITGQIVTAAVRLDRPETPEGFKLRMRLFCRGRLPPYAVPARLRLSDAPLHSERFKRIR